jgi:integrase
MAHFPKPFFREPRQRWFVQIGGKQINLGPDKDEAFRQYHKIMAEGGGGPPRHSVAADSSDELTVAEVFDKFLTWCKQHREPLTYQGYQEFIQSLLDHLKDKALLPALELRPFHITEWVDRHTKWGPTRSRNAIISVQRPYNWAVKQGYLDKSPIRYIEKPQAKRREHVISTNDWQKIRDHHAEADPFRDILEFCWECGCRPQEARHIEPRHLRLDAGRIEIPPAEAKGRKRCRVIYLTERAIAVIRRRVRDRTSGKVFLNADGNPWTADAINNRFRRLKDHLGVKHFAYAFRHSFANRLLTSKVDHLTVAELLGHVDGRTLATTYQHLAQEEGHLKEALKKASDSQG